MSPLGPLPLPQILTSVWAFLLGSPFKLAMWVGNRIATWTGLAVLWRKLKDVPNRRRRFLAWMVVINTLSVGLLIVFLWLVTTRHVRPPWIGH